MQEDQSLEELQKQLVCPESRRLLRERGLTLGLMLRDANGFALSGPAMQQLLDTLDTKQRESQHVQRLATVGALAAGVSHEARNLLTGILGFTQVLLTKSHDPATVRDMLRAIESETRRCVDILSSYLKLSRSGAEPVRPLRITEIVLPVERLVAHQLQQRGCTLTVHFDNGLPLTNGCCAELQRVLVNLIFNAADATQTGGRIQMAASASGPLGIEISVTDNGPGVPEALREHIFEAFFSTKSASDGTGLGLALSRSIVEAHGGQLVLDATSAPGARFILRLLAASGSTAD
jgi:two-component system NtrC family sensor kinase